MVKAENKFYIQYKLIIHTVVLVALAGMVFVYPFTGHFRFTFGIVVLSSLLLYFRQMPVMSTVLLSGLAVVVLRLILYFFSYEFETESAISYTLPAIAYYVSFAVVFYLIKVRDSISNVPVLLLKLAVTDIVSNIVEIIIRFDLTIENFETVYVQIAGVAVIRAVMAVYGFYALRQYRIFILRAEQLSRYAKLTMMVAKLRAELYYLQKSAQEVEDIMEHSYWLYNNLQSRQSGNLQDNETYAREALTIARAIHEVKKDYYRVTAGIENIIKPSMWEQGMKLSEILFIIEQNTARYLNSIGKKITITYSYTDDFDTDEHYQIVSMLDNLIINAIDACDSYGKIKVEQYSADGNIIFTVEDSGHGIAAEDFTVIFKPGYSTKFSPKTGKMSTGLGLAHVKNIVKLLGGEIAIASQQDVYTKFIITIPEQVIKRKAAADESII